MKTIASTLTASVLVLGLAACGSESPEPVEQIVVREPGQASPVTAASDVGDGADLAAAGRAAFAACVACHAVEKGEASTVGPNLFGVVGRTAGSLEGYTYSQALVGSGLIWDDDTLDAFLTNPRGKVPGTTMSAGTVGDAEKRAAIIAYLSTLSD